ncbi:hypothetical protein QWZ02_10590 [Kinneretia asaccharophila]|uniref:Novel STAND NTPase 1 domain-containing protein n=1 Tax=Roseateles asaccharophilus TaxID=582607 RepID=A0A4R6NER9_9BURK|nr:hypothetical protein [Roseateles asaccharophilus]MDN3544889.1 hypothetical protein [Roseateles asaccharophilus]TDP12724.1 hypothetical protein DFR39_101197 [Roseateles asaccharophilus]
MSEHITGAAEMGEEPAVTREQPWLGLASFSEASRQFFYGREEEVGELVRRVQRKLLTVLFGQSGLGKTSILKAGVVPRLREQGYCPVYVRIDYATDAPPAAEQIKQAIRRETQSRGQWTQVGVALEGESLWEFLHHRDDQLVDAEGRPVLPLLIFDQFEELFTLAQGDEAGRAKAAQFITELAELVENRVPAALEARLEEDDSAYERFDFARCDYRVLLALREDYLAHLESLKAQMPSITQNRMRLAPMTGPQALAAVRGPGAQLISQEVAEAVVRFVAGGAELEHAVVEPSLLSLILRELNDKRIAQGRREISQDLLAGSHAAILSDFYERSLSDQPAALRRFIEDVLLTDSGYRENVAEERVRSEFAAAGAAPDALSQLVNRRLLRIEERLDLRRVELTHDVLCSVVKASRDARRERESREATEALLAEQKQRAREARRALLRARQIAAVCAVLALGALGASGYAYWSSQRALDAERQAEAARLLTDQARDKAEGLLAFLLDDFFDELEPLGRLDLVVKLGERAVAYYEQLPPSLRGQDTERKHAQALMRLGAALSNQNRQAEAGPRLEDSVKRLQALRQQGDATEATLLGLGLASRHLARQQMQLGQREQALQTIAPAVQLLEPVLAQPQPSAEALLVGAVVHSYEGYLLQQTAAGGPTLERAAQALRRSQALSERVIAGRELRDAQDAQLLRAYALNAGQANWLMVALSRMEDKDGEHDQVAKLGLARLDTLLAVRPDHGGAAASRALLHAGLAQRAIRHLQMGQARSHALEAEQGWQRLLQRDPSNGASWNNLAVAQSVSAFVDWLAWRPAEAERRLQQALQSLDRGPTSSFGRRNGEAWLVRLVEIQTLSGRREAAQQSLKELERKVAERQRLDAAKGGWKRAEDEALLHGLRLMQYRAGWGTQALVEEAGRYLDSVAAKAPTAERERGDWALVLAYLGGELAEAELRAGRAEAASRRAAQTLQFMALLGEVTVFRQRDLARVRMTLAEALVMQGQPAKAAEVLEPSLAYFRPLMSRSQEAPEQAALHVDLLLTSALTQTVPGQRQALLAQTQATFTALPQNWRQTWMGQDQAKRLAAAQRGSPALP